MSSDLHYIRKKTEWSRDKYFDAKKEFMEIVTCLVNRLGYDAKFDIPDFIIAGLLFDHMYTLEKSVRFIKGIK